MFLFCLFIDTFIYLFIKLCCLVQDNVSAKMLIGGKKLHFCPFVFLTGRPYELQLRCFKKKQKKTDDRNNDANTYSSHDKRVLCPPFRSIFCRLLDIISHEARSSLIKSTGHSCGLINYWTIILRDNYFHSYWFFYIRSRYWGRSVANNFDQCECCYRIYGCQTVIDSTDRWFAEQQIHSARVSEMKRGDKLAMTSYRICGCQTVIDSTDQCFAEQLVHSGVSEVKRGDSVWVRWKEETSWRWSL